MDLRRVLAVVNSACEATGARWAVIGGVAMNAYGHARTTFDFDVASEDRHREEILQRLQDEGFRLLNDVPAFSNLLHPDLDLGRLDFLWLDEKTGERVFGESRALPIGGSIPIPVASPEHLVAMKVQAVTSRPTRIFRDGADLQFLLEVPGIDDNRVREFFESAGLLELLGRLRPGH
ncbi:MAG: nucleotidyl transferase AbiEii/AbiGii toxin family protein [Thermoanaerobaculia bacterium]